jgi:hypothetical protein
LSSAWITPFSSESTRNSSLFKINFKTLKKIIRTFSRKKMKTLTKEEQKALAKDASDCELRLDDKWYVVDLTWYQKWLNFIGLETTESAFGSPGPISNASLLDSDGYLKEGVIELSDYQLVPEKLWKVLLQTYGVVSEKVILK